MAETPKFKIVIDEKVEIWRQTEFEVSNCATIEEARDKAIAVINGGKDGDVVQQSSELNLETENKLSEKENYCMANADILVQGEFGDRDDYYGTTEFNADNSYQIVENPPQA
jgi:hypothetical protein